MELLYAALFGLVVYRFFRPPRVFMERGTQTELQPYSPMWESSSPPPSPLSSSSEATTYSFNLKEVHFSEPKCVVRTTPGADESPVTVVGTITRRVEKLTLENRSLIPPSC